jgi:hypothetical protein
LPRTHNKCAFRIQRAFATMPTEMLIPDRRASIRPTQP